VQRVVLLISLVLILSCKKKKTDIEPIEVVVPEPKICSIVSDTKSENLVFNFVYFDKKLVNIKGFNDFDTFVYTGDVITKAYHTLNKNAEIYFTWNKDLLTKVQFTGSDSQGKKFNYVTTLTHNELGKISGLVLDWPTYTGKVNTRFNYDFNGNMLSMEAFLDNQWNTVLENKEFDDKRSPYKDQKIGQILAYYMVYTTLNGGFNFTNYQNNNNVTKAVVTKGETKITYNYTYTYTSNKYPETVEYTRIANNKVEKFNQRFTYDCPK
jgi:hypothetical protein